jgi:transcriptional regulator with GAF, ATPase, and Fis domain
MKTQKYSNLKSHSVQYFDPSIVVPGWVGCSPAMKRMVASLVEAAPTHKPVLITGESGTGKESAARFIHKLSGRAPWVVLSCPNTTAELIESQLFGHKRGAFTGALYDYAGYFEQANGGTLFLDEIGELPLYLQPRLLRILQEGQLQRIGDTEVRNVSVRVICATHRDLAGMVQQGTFREDLYHRLAFFHIEVPPLRARSTDILLLAQSYLEAEGLPRRLSPSAQQALLAHHWPGNVRALQRVMYQAAIRSQEVINLQTLVPLIKGLYEQMQLSICNQQFAVDSTHMPQTPAEEEVTRETTRATLSAQTQTSRSTTTSPTLRRQEETPAQPVPTAEQSHGVLTEDKRAVIAKFQSATLTEGQLRVLAMIHPHKGMTIIELAKKLKISQSTVLRLLKSLIDEGLILRQGQARATVYFLKINTE